MDRTEKIMDEVKFIDFLLNYEEKIREVSDMLSKSFEDNIVNLEKQISTICSRMEFISWCLAYTREFLTIAQHTTLPTKRKDLTEMDRSISLEFSTSKETLFKDWLEGLDKKIDKYLSNAQSVLACKRVELDKLGYGAKE